MYEMDVNPALLAKQRELEKNYQLALESTFFYGVGPTEGGAQ